MHGLYLLWWVQEKQMPPAMVAVVLAAGDFALMALELPTGWFADRFGPRVSLIVGSCVQVAAMLWCWLGEGVSGLVIASVFIAIGDGFRSGADHALLYRTCLALDREHDFQKRVAQAEAVSLGALVVLVLIGGAVVQIAGFAAGWLAETMLCVAGLVMACAMTEPPAHSDARRESGERRDDTPAYCGLAMCIAPAALLGGAASAASFLAQTAGTSTPANVTLLVAAITAAEAGGSALASVLAAGTVRVQLLLSAAGALLFISGVIVHAALPLVALALGLLLGVAQPLRAAAIQRLAGDGIRARAASAASATDMAVSAIVLPLAGVWRGRRRT